jgi:hypothetical protein
MNTFFKWSPLSSDRFANCVSFFEKGLHYPNFNEAVCITNEDSGRSLLQLPVDFCPALWSCFTQIWINGYQSNPALPRHERAPSPDDMQQMRTACNAINERIAMSGDEQTERWTLVNISMARAECNLHSPTCGARITMWRVPSATGSGRGKIVHNWRAPDSSPSSRNWGLLTSFLGSLLISTGTLRE